jgi:hypothetical protein
MQRKLLRHKKEVENRDIFYYLAFALRARALSLANRPITQITLLRLYALRFIQRGGGVP